MNSLDSAQIAPISADSGGRPGIARHLWQLYIGLPDDLPAAISIVGLFAVICLAIAAAFGAPLNIPQERISQALGMNAVLPFGIAMGAYAVLRFVKARLGIQEAGVPALRQAVAVDLTLMTLFLIATYFHFSLKTWVQVINPNLYDGLYYAIDQDLQPVLELLYWLRSKVAVILPRADALYQGAFLFMFISGFCSLAISRNPTYSRFCVAVLATMCLGALSYLIAPALGPFVYEHGLNEIATTAQTEMLWAHRQAKAGGMAWIAAVGPNYFTGALSAMPSLHITHAIVMTYFIHEARSPLRGIFLLVCCWVAIESVASRWHYLIDLPAGIVLAALIIWLTKKLCGKRPHPAAV